MKKQIAVVALAVAGVALSSVAETYEAKWESLDKRPVPQWWRDAKFGIFVHWGPYAVPAYAPTDGKDIYACYAEWYHGRLIETNEQLVQTIQERNLIPT